MFLLVLVSSCVCFRYLPAQQCSKEWRSWSRSRRLCPPPPWPDSTPPPRSHPASSSRRRGAGAGGGGGGGGQGGWARTRLSCSFQRIRRPRHGHKEENAELNNNVAKLPEQYDTLKKVHADFEEFLSVVVEDLKEKVSRLQRFKASEAASAQERNYSALQLYMVEKYTARIQTFRGLASLHIQHICTIHSQTPASDISNLVTKVGNTVYSGNLSRF